MLMKKLQDLQIEEMFDDDESPINRVLNKLRKPSSVVIGVLVAALLFLGIRFGHMQHEINDLSTKVINEAKVENYMLHKLHGLQNQVHTANS